MIELLLPFNNIKKIEGLENLKKLKTIDLSYNLIKKIENFQGLDLLAKLYLDNNFIEDIIDVKELEKNYNLNELTLRCNPIARDYEVYREKVM